jgi:hypothetical protein
MRGTIADCDECEAIADWGEENLDFLRRFLPCHHGVPTGPVADDPDDRTNLALFSACFTAWVRETWPERLDFVAIDARRRGAATTTPRTWHPAYGVGLRHHAAASSRTFLESQKRYRENLNRHVHQLSCLIFGVQSSELSGGCPFGLDRER